MKIGILTYHRAENYGAVLQAYALKEFLSMQGHTVEFVDYFPAYHKEFYDRKFKAKNWPLSWKKKILYPYYLLRTFFPLYLQKEQRRRNFKEFIKKYLIDNELGLTDSGYNVVIYGSDQIWRKQKTSDFSGFDDVYFGNEAIRADKRIAFSASMGDVNLDENDQAYLKDVLRRFSAIAVREKNLLEAIKSFLIDSPLVHTLDPVFLLDKSKWMQIGLRRIIEQKYVLFYNFFPDEKADEIAQSLSERLGLPVVEIVKDVTHRNSKNIILRTIGPMEFLSLFAHAEFVISSSFHGVAFSIIFEKQFYAWLSKSRQRVVSLLMLLGIEDRLIRGADEINVEKKIDYTKVMPIVNRERERGIDFLVASIKG